jgi:hypothetical protein
MTEGERFALLGIPTGGGTNSMSALTKTPPRWPDTSFEPISSFATLATCPAFASQAGEVARIFSAKAGVSDCRSCPSTSAALTHFTLPS